VVHLDGVDPCADIGRHEADDHSSFDDTGLDTADGKCPDTPDLAYILEG
jgi:hypothetical protein